MLLFLSCFFYQSCNVPIWCLMRENVLSVRMLLWCWTNNTRWILQWWIVGWTYIACSKCMLHTAIRSRIRARGWFLQIQLWCSLIQQNIWLQINFRHPSLYETDLARQLIIKWLLLHIVVIEMTCEWLKTGQSIDRCRLSHPIDQLFCSHYINIGPI